MTQITDITTKVVELIAPLSSEDKKRVMRAALLLAGEETLPNDDEPTDTDSHNFPSRAQVWMKQNSLTGNELGEVFHIEDSASTVIAPSIPGKGGKEQTLNAYLLVGVGNLITTGTPTIDDKTARAVCNSMGCFSDKHHAEYIDDKGNLFVGTKKGGWTLTTPGLKAAALLIKDLTKSL